MFFLKVIITWLCEKFMIFGGRPGFDFWAYHLLVMWPWTVPVLLTISISSSAKWNNTLNSHRILVELAFCGLSRYIIHCLIFSWAVVFHFVAWSERKVPPALIREVSRLPWGMFIGECWNWETLGPWGSLYLGGAFALLKPQVEGKGETVVLHPLVFSGPVDVTQSFL